MGKYEEDERMRRKRNWKRKLNKGRRRNKRWKSRKRNMMRITKQGVRGGNEI